MSTSPDPALRAALECFAAGRGALAAGVQAMPLAGGVANRSWLVRSAAGEWVVRIAGSLDERFALNRVAELQAQRAAASLGFAPAVVHAEPARGVLVSEYLAGRSWSRADVQSEDGLRALGARLAELHRLPPPRAVRRLDMHAVLAHYLETPPRTPGPVSRAELAARLRWALATYVSGVSAFCHNDLHHLNVIAGERLMFVDWEYAGVGDPLFELAAVISYHDLDAGQRTVLLAAYGREFRPADVTGICLVFDCLHALWLDAADGWDSLPSDRRQALLERLAVDLVDRRR